MDKNKIIEAAAKLVAKGAYDKAIKEYQKILDVDPKDVRILQKMGELYQKKNDNAQAAIYFTRVAESYTNDGFFLKAVALYKQVLKLDPSLLDINIKLAELHQQLQLLGEAMAYYQIVANHFDKAGDTRKSLEVLKKMVDLDPDNIASRVKLADLYVREGLNQEAATEFTRAAEHLKRNNRIDDYLRVAERLSSLEPDNLTLAKELAELYLQRNDQKRALAKLQVCFKADNRDIDTLRLLAVAFQGLGQTSKTISVYKELARAYEERGQGNEAEQVWGQVAQLDPHDGDVAARQGPVTAQAPAVELYPAAMPTAHMPALQATPQPRSMPVQQATAVQGAHVPVATPAAKPKGDNIAKLLTETDVYVKYGLHDKALEHLRKVFSVEPENIDAHEKAYAIYVASNNHAQAFEQLLNVLRLHTRSGDAQRAQPYLATILQQNPGHPEVPVFAQALRAGEGQVSPVDDTQHDRSADDAILVDSTDDEVLVADDPNDEVISAEVALSQESPIPQHLDDEVLLTADDAYVAAQVEVDPPPIADAQDEQVWNEPELDGAPFLADQEEPSTGEFPMAEDDLDTGSTGVPVSSVEGADEAPYEATYEANFDSVSDNTALLNSPVIAPRSPFQPIPMQTVPMSAGPGIGDEHEAPTRVTHRLDPALLKTATRAPVAAAADEWGDEVQNRTPPPIDEPLEQVEPLSTYEEEPLSLPAEEAVEAPPEEEPAGEEVDEATFFVDQGLYDEAREILETVLIAYPEHQRAAQLLAQVDSMQASTTSTMPVHEVAEHQSSEGSHDAFNLAAELASELEGSSPSQLASPAGGDYQVSVEEVFAEFKKGLEKVVKPEDVDTHYDLGVAYKEMGLTEDAVSEFTIARKGCIGKRKEVDCLSMIGLLQMLRADFPAAVDAFMQALTSEHSAGDVEKALRYDLAAAFEGAGQLGKALSQYLKVQRLDPTFREVEAHVTRLSAIASPEEDNPGSGQRRPRKVGYV